MEMDICCVNLGTNNPIKLVFSYFKFNFFFVFVPFSFSFSVSAVFLVNINKHQR